MKALLLALLLPAAALAAGPLERNHPLVQEGMEAFDQGDYEAALRAFDAAKAERPLDATVEFNRGAALHRLGRNEEAKAALLHARELDKGPLQSAIHYNLGNVWAAMGNKKEAIAEYRQALRKDPNDGQARHNLEVLLRDLSPRQDQGGQDGGRPDGGQSDGGRPDAGPDGGLQDGGMPKDGGQGDAGVGDGGSDAGQDGGQQGGQDGGKGDGGQGDGGQGEQDRQGDAGQQGQSERPDGGGDGGSESRDGGESEEAEDAELRDGGASMSRKDAEKLLDSIKSSERNLQLWRFQQKRQRKPNGKDW